MEASSTRSGPLTGDRLLVLPHPRNWQSQVQQISHIGVAASHSPNDDQVAPIGGLSCRMGLDRGLLGVVGVTARMRPG